MAATKGQELKALEKIRKIVADLGEDSYIGMAFEGCFEIAADNIGNDFGCSMKQRWEKAQEDAEYFRQTASNLSNDLERANEEIQMLRKRVLTVQELFRIEDLIKAKIQEQETIAKDNAEVIVEKAEDCDSDDFKQAVGNHRNALSCQKSWNGILERVKRAKEVK